ncbi:hypothetical protein EVAR_89794_1 [Eumeta japonica]|uniref:Uncharacterized protein n=1 Tax=Eumeta variegata TaxID=151549 RepID=A0A4C2A2D8_EUMVA|nr:hypothetical protein EVAR_89794_1 [Eumeta japonica]
MEKMISDGEIERQLQTFFLKKKWHRKKAAKQGTKIALLESTTDVLGAGEMGMRSSIPQQLISEAVDLSATHPRTLLSRASQDDGWLATVSDAPLPLHFMGGASVAITTLQDTEPSPQLTPARRSSKWDAAERHQSSRRPPRTWLSGPGGLLNSASRHEYRGDDDRRSARCRPRPARGI